MIKQLIRRKSARLLPILGLALALSACVDAVGGVSGSSGPGGAVPGWNQCYDPYHYSGCGPSPAG